MSQLVVRNARFKQVLASIPDVGDDEDFAGDRDLDRQDGLPRWHSGGAFGCRTRSPRWMGCWQHVNRDPSRRTRAGGRRRPVRAHAAETPPV